MPKFRVLRRVDAWIDYVAEIEAQTAQGAAAKACAGDAALSWRRVGEEEFWNARYAVLDEDGSEIPGAETTRG